MTSRAPVSLCMIVKNEENQIENCLKSIRPFVDQIVIVDTGSKDKTPEICRRYADTFETFTACNDADGRITSFAKARQRSFDLASHEWAMWIDGDDEVQGAENLPGVVAEAQAKRGENPFLIMFPYEYAHDHHGNVTCLHYRERLVTPSRSFKWQGPVHEVLVPTNPSTVFTKLDAVRIIHKRDASRKPMEPMRNLRILKAYFDEIGESDVRQLYYLGLEYGNVNDVDNALKFHKRYIELSGWDDEKCLSCLKVAEHYQNRGEFEQAVDWALKASIVKEGWAEPYFNLCKSFYFLAQKGGPVEQRNWERCVYFARAGLSQKPTDTVLFINPLERNYEIHKYLNFALNRIGDVKSALDSARSGLMTRPDDDALKGNIRLYEIHLARVDMEQNLQRLTSLGGIEAPMASAIRDVLQGKVPSHNPIVVRTELHPDVIVSSIIEQTESKKNPLDIAFYVGYGCEPWNPQTFGKTGLGGSETAVIEMTKRLVRMGHKVRVYGDCAELEGIFDGVRYVHFDKFKNVECDVLVTSRRPHVVDDEFGVKARAVFCWVHDVSCGAALNHTRALRIDRFLCLSRWHRGFFLETHKNVHPDQVIVTRNGIDMGRFEGTESGRDPHRAVYMSSPDRGLEVAVKIWPEVRKRVADATLHIYYGFHNWEVAARSINDRGQLDLIERLKREVEANKPHGVFYHGRQDQKMLAREFMKSGVWTYPTWFSESSCISAMEAQAAGLKIVTSPIAALNETVGARGRMIPGDWLSPEYQAKFTDAVVDAMREGQDTHNRWLQHKYAAENFGMHELAESWDKMFRTVLVEVERDVIPAYVGAR